jgi:hypothetical protein
LGDLVSHLRVDSQGWDSGLAKGRKSLGGFVKSATSGLAQIGLAAQGLKTAFSLVAGPIQEAREGLAEDRKLAQVFRSTGNAAGVAVDEIKAFAEARQDATNFDAGATTNAAALLGSFTNVRGGVFTDALKSAQDLSAFMGTDLESSIMQIGKALNDPARGVSALAKSGIQFTQSQKEQIRNLQEIGDLASAQEIILKELQTQFGGQAEALVDPIIQAENAWKDAMGEMGLAFTENLAPVMPQIIEGIKTVTKFIADTVNRIGEMVGAIDDLALAAAALVKGEDVGAAMAARDAAKASANAPMAEFKDQQLDDLLASVDKAISNRGVRPKSLKEEIIGDDGGFTIDPAALEGIQRPANQEERDALLSMVDKVIAEGPQALAPKVSKSDGRMIGSLEANSSEAFEVLRANVGAGGKDDIPKKTLTEQQKQTELLKKLVNKKPDPGRSIKVVDID